MQTALRAAEPFRRPDPGAAAPVAPIWTSAFVDRLIEPFADLVLVHPRVLRRDLPLVTRGSDDVSLVRQIVMYLLLTRLGLTHTAVAALVGRDRTTVAHAARTIEDRRDEAAFDAALEAIEASIRLDPFPPLPASPIGSPIRRARQAAIAAALGLAAEASPERPSPRRRGDASSER